MDARHRAERVEAETANTSAWTAAIDTGLPEEELREYGFEPPVRKQPGRPKGRRGARATRPVAPPGGESTPAENSAPSAPETHDTHRLASPY